MKLKTFSNFNLNLYRKIIFLAIALPYCVVFLIKFYQSGLFAYRMQNWSSLLNEIKNLYMCMGIIAFSAFITSIPNNSIYYFLVMLAVYIILLFVGLFGR